MPLPMRPPVEPPDKYSRNAPAPEAKELPDELDGGLPAIDFSSIRSVAEAQPTASAPAAAPAIDEGLPSLDIQQPAEAVNQNDLSDFNPNPDFDEDDFDSLLREFDEPAPEAPIKNEELIEDDWDSLEEDSAPVEALDEDYLNGLFDDEEEEFQEPTPVVEETLVSPESASDWSDDDFDDFMDKLDVEETQVIPEPEEYVSTFDEEETEVIPDEEAFEPLKKDPKKNAKKRKAHRAEKKSKSLLQILAGIPILGLIFKPFAKLGVIGGVLLSLIVLAAIAAGIYFIAASSVPAGNTVYGPDGAAATIGEFSYADGAAQATIVNSGEIVAPVTATFTVWSYNPFSGGSIFAFDEVNTCVADEVAVDIDASATVSVPCEIPGTGLFSKVSGTIDF